MDNDGATVNARRLSYNFGTHWALKDISFHLPKGSFTFLTGPSGAGKTTLLRLLHGSLPVDRGSVNVAGYELKGIRRRHVAQLRRHVSVVFQDFKILPQRSVAENVALPLEVRGLPKRAINRRINAVLRGLDLASKVHCRCEELSGGEQQRVAIARAIVVNPKLLLADEPTGNLDIDLALRLMNVFRQFNAYGTTILLATHNRDIIQSVPHANRITLDDGHIVDQTVAEGAEHA
ncbi:cell division ATP-binding protein FtsE [Desulfobaculum bizertense]|uniref:Cell division ATP-binding protein FtsE n=1 Tax=Desulfobaculum bizertense DSM 18034 TaxID=1121442 RepID=A0A1T4X1A5_9BACT|nr:cell division ATP-binding protein FtsE [Desulfobaculum bizertense]UIJ37341.1 cell division ATP-binding protein FtsE [Desulfobaculum bizertense]SKA82908.1 cell division transport system ATP-binding protein [Desulfobaculum bizertense DSM 18034]